MYLSHLTLTHFRNYRSLAVDFPRPFTLLQGQNAQGKTNLLEAIYFLATSKSSHARVEKEVVDWAAESEPIPHCRIEGRVQRAGREVALEILFAPREDGAGFRKQVRINGVNKRSMDLLGQLRAVLFLPEDIILVAGGPGERRRYLDIALCQMDRTYCQELTHYQKVLTQRNSLLRNLREQGVKPGSSYAGAQLEFWDGRLVQHGSAIMARRQHFVYQLQAYARLRHGELTGGQEFLSLHYAPNFNPGHLSPAVYQVLSQDGYAHRTQGHGSEDEEPELAAETARTHFLAKLADRRGREIAYGGTLYGPHRDDMLIAANGHDLRTYGSRGQQRTAALAIKLAEVQAMTENTGEAPLLLLDDVMSELDAQRRGSLLTALAEVNQAVITTTDWEDFPSEFRQQALCRHVDGGKVTPA